MIAAFLLVLPLAFVYVRTRTRVKFDHSLVQTVIVLPIVVTAILVVVRDSLALAFSLAGIVAAVRFRNNLKESGDAVYIFGSIGIGFATGIHAISVAGGPVDRLRGGRAGALEVRLQRRVRAHLRPALPAVEAPTWRSCPAMRDEPPKRGSAGGDGAGERPQRALLRVYVDQVDGRASRRSRRSWIATPSAGRWSRWWPAPAPRRG